MKHMATDRETALRELSKKIQELVESHEIINLLDSMGFFALLNLFEIMQKTEECIAAALETYIGAVFTKPKETVGATWSRKRINSIVSAAFAPA